MMQKSKYQKMYLYDWFCGPGSHYNNIFNIFIVDNNREKLIFKTCTLLFFLFLIKK